MPKRKLLIRLLISGLWLVPILSSAHTYVGIFNVGAKAGFIPFEKPHNTVFTAGVQAQIVKFEPDLALVGFADYWQDEYSLQE